jgi:HD-GYP domain-containing protein (c-di-GMP phosphodiesterase class II)
VLSEGTPLRVAVSADSRRYLPYAVLATLAVVVVPAVVVLPLAPLEGLLDLVVSAALTIGLSVVMGSICSALWSRLPESQEVVFGDLMIWRWARRALAERRMARSAERLTHERFEAPTRIDVDPLLPALQRLATELEARDSYMRGHSERVARHAERIALEMGLDDGEVAKIQAAATVHDVGKLFVPHSILTQAGRLTDDEFTLIKRHAEQGAELVSELDDPELTAIVRHHHERVDGTGYPDGLAGSDIPIGARIIAVADSFDAMTSERPFRSAATQKSALDEISEAAGSQLDPAVVAAFLDYYSGKRAIAGVAFVATAPQRLVSWIAATPAGIGASTAPIAQGVCAAGAVAVAGVCMGGAPALLGSDPDGQATRSGGEQIASAPQGLSGGALDERDEGRDSDRDSHKDSGNDRGSKRGSDRSQPQGGSDDGIADRGTPVGSPSPSNPSVGGGGGGGGAPVTSPESVLPGTPVDPSSAPVSPQGVLDPVVDTVDQVIAPAPEPVQELLDPVKDLLGRTGLTTP